MRADSFERGCIFRKSDFRDDWYGMYEYGLSEFIAPFNTVCSLFVSLLLRPDELIVSRIFRWDGDSKSSLGDSNPT